MIKAVIFDVDDTLYSYTRGNILGTRAVEDYMADRFGFDPARTAAAVSRAMALVGERMGYVCAAVHNRAIRYQVLLENEGLPVLPHARNLEDVYWNAILDNIEIAPGIVDLIRALKEAGIRVGIGTNMTVRIQYDKLERIGVWEMVDFIVSSEEAGVEKPDPRFYDLCVEKAGCAPSEIAFIGDSLKNDAISACEAGMCGIWYCPPDREMKADCPVPVIRDFRTCLTPEGIRLGEDRQQ